LRIEQEDPVQPGPQNPHQKKNTKQIQNAKRQCSKQRQRKPADYADSLGTKPEIQNPKYETNSKRKKSEIRSAKFETNPKRKNGQTENDGTGSR